MMMMMVYNQARGAYTICEPEKQHENAPEYIVSWQT